jgi:hypothetical protein
MQHAESERRNTLSIFDIPKSLQGALGIRNSQLMQRPWAFDDPVTATRLALDNHGGFAQLLSDEVRRGDIMRRRRNGLGDDPLGPFEHGGNDPAKDHGGDDPLGSLF